MTDLLARIERGEPVEAQEIFDFAVGKVIEQGAPATGGVRGFCMYRTEDGNKCAFGHLIPDSLYRTSFEGAIATHVLVECYNPRLAASLARHAELIGSLQRAHDYAGISDFSFNFWSSVEAVAKKHGLTFNF